MYMYNTVSVPHTSCVHACVRACTFVIEYSWYEDSVALRGQIKMYSIAFPCSITV